MTAESEQLRQKIGSILYSHRKGIVSKTVSDSVNELIDAVVAVLPNYEDKSSRSYEHSGDLRPTAHKNGYSLAVRDFKGILQAAKQKKEE